MGINKEIDIGIATLSPHLAINTLQESANEHESLRRLACDVDTAEHGVGTPSCCFADLLHLDPHARAKSSRAARP